MGNSTLRRRTLLAGGLGMAVTIALLAAFGTVRSAGAADSGTGPTALVYRVERAGGGALLFRACGGLGSENEVLEFREGTADGSETIRSLPGDLRQLPVVCERGISADLVAAQWRAEVERGDIGQARSDVAVTVLDQAGGEVARWNFRNAWPMKLEVVWDREILTLVHEGGTRVQ